MVDLRVEFHLPGLTVTADKVELKVPRRRSKQSGPFLMVSRASGLAVDTARAREPGHLAVGWPVHGLRHQLWYLVPAGRRDEVVVKSADTGLVLEAQRSPNDPHVAMEEASGEPWQRWLLRPTPDGIGYSIQSVHTRLYLAISMAATEAAASGNAPWGVWFKPESRTEETQWAVLQAIGFVQ